jgi:hypothetical protein
MRSPVDRATRFSIRVLLTITVYLVTFQRFSAFLIAEKGGKTISTARGSARPEVTSPIDSLTPIWYRKALEFCVYLSPIKSYSTFSICMQNSLWKFGGRGTALKNFFHRWDSQKHFLVANHVVWGISLANRPARFGGGSWQVKSKKNWGIKKFATSPYWADEPLGAIVMKVGL